MAVAPAVIDYVINGIGGTPTVLRSLLGTMPNDDPRWDERLDPARFTLREVVAHLADWDEIYLRRAERTLTEDKPTLENIDEGTLAEERGYARQDAVANLNRFAENRLKLVAKLREVKAEEWGRTAHREFVGDVTLFEIAVMVLGHDAYHLHQAASPAGRPTG
ncbi:MAG: DinB family protein [Fimbriimonadaceae bacterium]|nr:DinB family protein [Fimbriimonadaceae bacterium]QYK55545.1 MAG: DinB family protein [Fimbriimonadaceae bacterium]